MDKKFNCKYCKKAFVTKQRKQTHEEICNTKEYCEQKDKEIEELKLNYENTIVNLNNENKNLKNKIEDLKSIIDNYKDKLINLLPSQTTINHQTINNSQTINSNLITVNNTIIQPLDISLERFESIINEKYDYGIYKKSKESGKVIILDFLSNDLGIPQATICDQNRGKIKIFDISTNCFRRISCDILHDYFSKSQILESKIKDYNKLFEKETNLTDDEKKDELILRHRIFYDKKFYKANIFPLVKVDLEKGQHTSFKPSIRQAEIIEKHNQIITTT